MSCTMDFFKRLLELQVCCTSGGNVSFLHNFLHDPKITSVFPTIPASSRPFKPTSPLSISALLEVEETLRSWRKKEMEETAQPIGNQALDSTF